MRKYFLPFCVVQLLACSPEAQQVNTAKFDIKAYAQCVADNQSSAKMNPHTCIRQLPNGTVIENSSSVSGHKEYFTSVITPPPPALMQNVKEYYGDGTLRQEYDTYVGVLIPANPMDNTAWGVEKSYDEQGTLTKQTDHDKVFENVKIKLPDLFEILERTPLSEQEKNKYLLNPHDDNDRRSLTISFRRDRWHVIKDMYPMGFIDIEIDAQTGEILARAYRQDHRP